jgi:oligosaccharide repeat unit polymerase
MVRRVPVILLFSMCAATAVVSLGLFYLGEESWHVGWTCAAVAWASGLACIWLTRTHTFDLSLLYLAILGTFHLPLVPLVWLGVRTRGEIDWMGLPTVGPSLLLCAVACGSAVSGVTIHRWFKPRHLGPQDNEEVAARYMPTLMQAGIVLGVGAIIMLVIGARQLNLFSGSYTEYWSNSLSADTRLFGTGLMFAMIAAVLTSAGAPARAVPLCALAFAVVFAPLVLFGFRSQFVVYSVAMLPIWYIKRPTFTRRLGLAVFVAVVIGSPAVKAFRTEKAMTPDDILERLTPVEFIAETGYSLRPLVETLSLLDTGATSWWMGRSYLEAVNRIMPNLGAEKRNIAEAMESAPNQWLTGAVKPWLLRRGMGFGYSGVAEPYLNFGAPGVVFYFLLLGLVLETIDSSLGRRPYLGAWAMCAFGCLLLTTRNDFTTFARPAVWSAALVACAYVVDNALASRKAHRVSVGGSGQHGNRTRGRRGRWRWWGSGHHLS